MTLRELQRQCRQLLCRENAEFEARQIVMSVLNMDKTDLIMHGGDEIDNGAAHKCRQMCERRNSGEPLYYIIGQTEFYGLPFYVGRGVLIPRQDTETLIDKVLEFVHNMKNMRTASGGESGCSIRILDLCSGSGCIGITLAKMIENSTVDCVELYENALDYLNKNILLNKCKNVSAIKANALDFCGEYDIIVSNPPYVRWDEKDTLSVEVLSEPHSALFAGDEGLVFYKSISRNFSGKCGAVFFEIGETQGEQVADILRQNGFCNIKIAKDANGLERVVRGENTAK